MNAFVLFATERYGLPVLEPLARALAAAGGRAYWFGAGGARGLSLPGAEPLASVSAVRALRPRAVFCAANWVPHFFPGAKVQSDDELLGAAKQRGTTTFHLMGTCRMAPDSDPTAVVDDQLRVRGIQGLRVVDASIMPTMPSANLNASVLMIAEKGADMIRGRQPLEATILKD